MITVPGILAGDADLARGLLGTPANVAVSTGARAAALGAKRTGDVEAWTFQRVEDVESLLALLEDRRRHGTLRPRHDSRGRSPHHETDGGGQALGQQIGDRDS